MSKEMDEEYKAFKQGFALHDNSHCTPISLKENYIDWCMGFCAEKQKQANNEDLKL